MFTDVRRLAAILGMFVVLAVPTACSSSAPAEPPDSAPRTPTAAQVERLAVFRFNAYQAGTLAVRGTVVGDQSVTINGWIDTVEARGYAVVQAPEARNPGAFLTKWNTEQVSAQDYSGISAPLPPPDNGWQSTGLDPSTSVVAAAQALLVSLSADRPDNAQLLLQGGVTWLGAGTVNGVQVDIMSGPVAEDSATGRSSFRYWIDADGNLLRVQALLDGIHLSTFDVSPASDVSF